MKKYVKYIKQGKKMAKIDPVIGFYSAMFAVKHGVAIANKTPEDKKLLMDVMTILEQSKTPAIEALTPQDAQAHCELFAAGVFTSADKQDRSGNPIGKKVAQTFLSASCFIDICAQFGPLDAAAQERSMYCKWKAMDIMKALKEGREPLSGTHEEQAAAAVEAKAVNNNEENSSSEHVFYDDMEDDIDPFAALGPIPGEPQQPSSAVGDLLPPQAQAAAQEAAAAAAAQVYDVDNDVSDPFAGLLEPPKRALIPPVTAPPAADATMDNFSSLNASSYAPPAANPAYALPEVKQQPVVPVPAQQQQQQQQQQVVSAGSVVVECKQIGEVDRPTTLVESERLLKHALSALSFDDMKTASLKIQQALALIYPYQDAAIPLDDEAPYDWGRFEME